MESIENAFADIDLDGSEEITRDEWLMLRIKQLWNE
jgi:hypothetical protein